MTWFFRDVSACAPSALPVAEREGSFLAKFLPSFGLYCCGKHPRMVARIRARNTLAPGLGGIAGVAVGAKSNVEGRGGNRPGRLLVAVRFLFSSPHSERNAAPEIAHCARYAVRFSPTLNMEEIEQKQQVGRAWRAQCARPTKPASARVALCAPTV